MHCGKGKLCHLALTRFCLWGGGHSKQFIVFGGQEENVSDKENSPSPPVRDLINERSLT